jgi:hypothetical protein
MDISNHLRVDLYSKLLPAIIKEDMAHGVESITNFWDDPDFVWDEGKMWDELGILPVIKNLFYCIEQEEVADLREIDHLRDLVDPNLAPDKFLDYLALTLGHPLEEGLTTEAKREVIRSVIALNKVRGRDLSWPVFFRLLGFQVVSTPLWKKNVHEENDDYSRTQYKTEQIIGEVLGTPGLTNYSGSVGDAPIQPGSFRLHVNGLTFRDNGDKLSSGYGTLISPDGSTGRINYATGRYQVNLAAVAATNLEADYKHITEEFPYHAARVDLELTFFLNEEPSTATESITEEFLHRVLARLELVRPIHVLVRLLIVVLDAPEVIDGFCTDTIFCGPTMGKDVRSDEYRFYAADLASGPGDAGMLIERTDTTNVDFLEDDLVNWCQVPDTLTIEFSNGDPAQYW